jgi:ABC-type molybdate transport system substrate-binding protein
MKARHVVRVIASGVLFALAVAACGSDNSSTSATTTPTTAATTTTVAGNAALCTARDALKDSLQKLTSVDVVKNGTSSLQAALTTVTTNLQSVKAAASQQLQPQVSAFETSLQQLQTALGTTGSAGLTAIATAAADAARTGSALLLSLQNLNCS